MLKYDRIDVPKGIDANKTNTSNECVISHCLYFIKVNFMFQLFMWGLSWFNAKDLEF